MKKLYIILLCTLFAWLVFQYGLYLGIRFGLNKALNSEISGLNDINTTIKIYDKKDTIEEKHIILKEHNDVVKKYIVQRKQILDDMAFIDVLITPIDTLNMICLEEESVQENIESIGLSDVNSDK
ncbi:MAG: hypothetical protein ABW134_17010 [Candidatus Thiodiazotropha endolucinida]